jgi:hypothetical protein
MSSKSNNQLDDDEVSDLDDDVDENENTIDWFEEEDEAPLEENVVFVEEKPKITDPYLLANIDLYHALCDVEDLNFEVLDLEKQTELMKTLRISTQKPGETIFSEDEEDSTSLYFVVASERTAKVAEVELLRKSEDKANLTRLRRGHLFGHNFFRTKQAVRILFLLGFKLIVLFYALYSYWLVCCIRVLNIKRSL